MTAAISGSHGASTPRSGQRPLSSVPRSWLVLGAVLPLVLLALMGALLLGRGGASGARIGSPAPAFDLADLDGTALRLADFRGQPVIVNFWASWCGPCVEEFPLLRAAAQEHAGDGLAVIGIVFRDSSASASAFMARMGAGWPTAMDPGEKVAEAYGIFGPPETFFIDRDGTIVARQIGQLSAGDLERHLARILPEE